MPSHQFGVDVFQMCLQLRILLGMEREQLPARAAETGAYLLEGLRRLLSLPAVGDVRGKGLLLAVELVEDRATRAPLGGARMAAVVRGCLERGVIVGRSSGAGGGFGNCITLAPPLVLTRGEADRIVETLHTVLSGGTACKGSGRSSTFAVCRSTCRICSKARRSRSR